MDRSGRQKPARGEGPWFSPAGPCGSARAMIALSCAANASDWMMMDEGLIALRGVGA